MTQEEFFKSIMNKKMTEATITLECGCRLIYSPVTEEIFGKPCTDHRDQM
jgi:hypothetical protein